MWLVAIAWIYVVGLMSVTETSVVGGVMTFIFYCVVPLGILFYLTGGRRRRARRAAAESADTGSASSSSSARKDDASDKDCRDGGVDSSDCSSSD